MITETVTIELRCDRKNCPRGIQSTEATRDDANMSLFVAGWRLCNGKQICPQCVERRAKRRKR